MIEWNVKDVEKQNIGFVIAASTVSGVAFAEKSSNHKTPELIEMQTMESAWEFWQIPHLVCFCLTGGYLVCKSITPEPELSRWINGEGYLKISKQIW